MVSMPPARMMSAPPQATHWQASTVVWRELAHWVLTSVPQMLSGKPASIM